MEITSMTFITMAIIFVGACYAIYFLLKELGKQEDIHSTLNYPLKNKNKYWYNH